MGHLATVCHSTNQHTGCVNTVVEEGYLGAIDSGSCCTKHLFINGVPVWMKLDMGGDIIVIPEIVYYQLLRLLTKAHILSTIHRNFSDAEIPDLKNFN